MCAAPATDRLTAARTALAVASRAMGVPAITRAPEGTRNVFPTGIPVIDAALDGGLPRGALVEIVGGPSSGRFSWTLALLSRALRSGDHAALIDVPDALDPRALHLSERQRLLWVRPNDPLIGMRCADLLLDSGGVGLIALYLVAAPRARARAPTREHVTARQGIGTAAWTRLAQRALHANACLLIVRDTTDAYAPGACAQVSFTVRQDRASWGGRDVLESVRSDVIIVRNRRGAVGVTAVVTFEASA